MKVFGVIVGTLRYPTKFSAGYFKCLRHLDMINRYELGPTKYLPPGVAAGSLAEYSLIPKMMLDTYVLASVHLDSCGHLDIWLALSQRCILERITELFSCTAQDPTVIYGFV